MSEYKSIKEFYPFYLSQHADPRNRRLHFMGTCLVIASMLYALLTAHFALLILLPVFGYGFAWFGHFIIEKNKPATFKYPFFSLACDFIMFWDMLTGRLPKQTK